MGPVSLENSPWEGVGTFLLLWFGCGLSEVSKHSGAETSVPRVAVLEVVEPLQRGSSRESLSHWMHHSWKGSV